MSNKEVAKKCGVPKKHVLNLGEKKEKIVKAYGAEHEKRQTAENSRSLEHRCRFQQRLKLSMILTTHLVISNINLMSLQEETLLYFKVTQQKVLSISAIIFKFQTVL